MKVPPRSTGKAGPTRALMRCNYGDTTHNFIIVVGLLINRVLFVRERGLFFSVECITRVRFGSVEQPHHYNSANKGWDVPNQEILNGLVK